MATPNSLLLFAEAISLDIQNVSISMWVNYRTAQTLLSPIFTFEKYVACSDSDDSDDSSGDSVDSDDDRRRLSSCNQGITIRFSSSEIELSTIDGSKIDSIAISSQTWMFYEFSFVSNTPNIISSQLSSGRRLSMRSL